MSEFTSGFITSSKDKEKIKNALAQSKLKYIIKEMNEKWVYFFIENEYQLKKDSFKPIIEFSTEFAIMNFCNAEDHGWGYRIFHNGKIIASTNITYIREYIFNITLEKLEQKYPGIDVIQEFFVNTEKRHEWEKIEKEVVGSKTFEQEVNALVLKMIVNKNVESFKYLYVDAQTISRLDSFLTVDTFLSAKNEIYLAQEFKSLIEIDDFNWLSYEYLLNE